MIDPAGIVCLGATAAQFLLGRDFRITHSRGSVQQQGSHPWIIATWHPSAVLRAPTASDRERLRGELIADLQRARTLLEA